MNAKKQILQKIRRKAKKIREIRTNSDKKLSYEEVIFIFFKEMEHIYAVADTAITFQTKLESASHILYSKIRSFDHGVNLELIWNDVENWKELRLNGVRILWSEEYLKNNPDQTKEMYIDVVNLLFRG